MDRTKIAKLLGAMILFSALMPAAAFAADLASGVFVDQHGSYHYWYVDSNKHLLYDNQELIAVNGSEGVYYCRWETGHETELNELKEDTPINEIISFGISQDIIICRLADYIDCQYKTHGYSEDNGGIGHVSRVLSINGRNYRVTDYLADTPCYFIYYVSIQNIDAPHIIAAQIPNDRERYITLRIQPSWENVGVTRHTGRNYPVNTSYFNFMYLFFPTRTYIPITISWYQYETTALTVNSGAAVSQIWVLEIEDDISDKRLDIYEPSASRYIGLGNSAPEYLGNPGSDLYGHKGNYNNYINYMKFVGFNFQKFNAINGADEAFSPHYRNSKVYTNAWQPGDSMTYDILAATQANNIKTVPVVSSFVSPNMQFGYPTWGTYGWPNGDFTGWNSMCYQKNTRGDTTVFFGALPDPVYPVVQTTFNSVVEEVAKIANNYSNIIGIGTRSEGMLGFNFAGSWGGSALGGIYPDSSGYSVWDITHFNADKGRACPTSPPGTACTWLKTTAGAWEDWLDWRSSHWRDMLISARNKIQSVNASYKLWVSTCFPSQAPGKNLQWPGYSQRDILRGQGYDPNMFTGDTGIIIERNIRQGDGEYFSYAYGDGSYYGQNPSRYKAWDYAAEVNTYYGTADGKATEIASQYFEEAIGWQGTKSEVYAGGGNAGFWGCATTAPPQRYAFEPYAYNMVNANPWIIEIQSWERGSCGLDAQLRSFVRSFRGLDNVAPVLFSVSDGSTSTVPAGRNIWVRWFNGRLGIVSLSSASCTLNLTINRTLKQNEKLVDLATNRILLQTGSGTIYPMTCSITLKAFDLHTVCTFTVPAGDTLTNANASYIILNSFVTASNGATRCTATVFAANNTGTALPGKNVVLSSNWGNSQTITGNPGTTDINGQCTFTIRSEYPGGIIATAVSDSININRTISLNKPLAVGIWRFDETSGIVCYDISGNTNTARFSDASVQRINGRFNRGIGLNGATNSCSVTNNISLVVTGPITVEAYIYINTFTSSCEITSKGNNVMRFYAGQADRRLHVVQSYTGVDYEDTGGTALVEGRWYHVAYTYDGSFTKIFLNGELDGMSARAGTLGINANNLLIGRGNGATINGFIDEVRIYRFAVSQEQVQADCYAAQGQNMFFSGALSFEKASIATTVNNPSWANYFYITGATGKRANVQIPVSVSASAGILSPDKSSWHQNSFAFTVSSGEGYFYYTDSATGNNYVTLSRYGVLTSASVPAFVMNQSPNNTCSYLLVSASTIKANAADVSFVTLNLLDTFGYPISGMNAAITSARSRYDSFTLVNPPGFQATTAAGTAAVTIRSGYAGYDTISGYCAAGTVSRTVEQQDAMLILNFNSILTQTLSATATLSYFADYSGNNNKGSLPQFYSGAVVEGKSAAAFRFDGTSDYVNCGSGSSLNLENTDPVTILFWINISDTNPITAKEILAKANSMGANVQRGYRVFQDNFGTKINFQEAYERQPGADYFGVYTTNNIGGGWHYVAITYDGSKNANGANFYVDGALAAKSIYFNGLTGTIANTTNLTIGKFPSASNYYDGTLDELRMYRRVLTPAEINQAYNGRVRFTPTKLEFTTFPVSALQNIATSRIDVEARGAYAFRDLADFGTVTLSVSTASGKFSVSDTTWVDTTIITLSAGLKSFYYRDGVIGIQYITVSRQGLTPDSQPIEILVSTPPYPGKSIKTIEYFIDQATADRTINISYPSPSFSVYIPETGFILRSAWIEVNFQSNTVTGAIVLPAGSQIGVNGANSQTFGVLVPHSGEDMNYCLRYNAAAAFSGMTGSGTNNGPYYAGVRIMGTGRANESVKLYLTYEYDEASHMQMKTVRYYAGSLPSNLAAASTATFAHTPYIPETGYSITKLWYEIRGHVQPSSAINDLSANIKLNGASLQSPKLVETGLTTGQEFLYLYDPAVNPGIGSGNTLTINGIGVVSFCVSAELVATYLYNYNGSANLIQTVRRYLGQTDVVSAAAESTVTYTREIYFPEQPVSPLIRSIYAVIRTTNSLNLNLGLAQNFQNTTVFAVGGTGDPVVAEGITVLYDLSPQYGYAEDSASVSVNAAWSAAGGGSRSAELVYTYEYPKNPQVAQKTVFFGADSGKAIQDTFSAMNTRTYKTNVYLPETYFDSIICACVYAKATSGETTTDVRFKAGAGSNTDYITLDQDGEARYAERLKDVTGRITGAGEYNIGLNLTNTSDAARPFLGSAISYLTYNVGQGSVSKLDISSPQRTVDIGAASDTITVQAQNNYGQEKTDFSGTVTLAASSATGKFSISPDVWQNTTTAYIASGEGNFFYMDTNIGTFTITVTRPGLRSDTQLIVLTRLASETTSYIRVNVPSVPADGVSFCTAVITIKDRFGALISGRQVALQTSRITGQTSFTYPYTDITDANGQCTAAVFSGYAGPEDLTVLCDLKTIAGNLVTNPSFENDSASWAMGSATIDTTSQAKTGSKSCKITVSGSFASGAFSDTISVTNNSISNYEISGYIRAQVSSGTYAFLVSFFTAADVFISGDTVASLASTSSWARAFRLYGGAGSGAAFMFPSNCAKIRITACSWAGAAPNGTGWTDDIRVRRIPLISFTSTRIRISSVPFTLEQGVPSNKIIVEASGETGGVDASFSGTVTLVTTSSNGNFSLSRTSWQDTTVAMISSGAGFFYYQDSDIGSPDISVFLQAAFQDSQTESIIAVVPVYETASFISFKPNKLMPNSADVCTATVTVKNSSYSPCSGKYVVLQTSKGAQDTITGNPGTTDENGQCTFFISSDSAGKDTVTALCGGVTVTRGFNITGAAGVWPFDDGADDISGNNNNGALYGGSGYSPGKYSEGLYLDGQNGFAEVPYSPTLDISDSITIDAWVYLNGFNASTSWHNEIVCKKNSFIMRFLVSNEFPATPRLDIPVLIDGNMYRCYGTTHFDTGLWYHVVYTFDGQDLRVYVNGAVDGTTHQTGTLDINGDGLWIGRLNDASYFDGIMDDLKIYRHALSLEEIRSSYTGLAHIYFMQPASLKFTSAPITMTKNNPSTLITVEVQDEIGGRDLAFSSTITLTADPTGRFSLDGVNWSGTNITVITLSTGAGSFYYKDSVAASHLVTISRPGYATDTQAENILEPSAYASNSYLVFTPSQVMANGVAASTVTVIINDTYAYPSPSITGVTVSAARGSVTVINAVGGTTTDANGMCTFTLRSSVSGIDTIVAVVQGNTITKGIDKTGLAAMWPFETNTLDISGNKNHGTLSGSPSWAAGMSGRALRLDGTVNYLNCGNSSSLNFENTTPLTFMFWANINNLDPANSKEIINKAWQVTGNEQRGYRVFQYPNTIINFQEAYARQDGFGGETYLCAYITSGVGAGWHHVAITYKGDSNANNINFYVDGAAVPKFVEKNNLAGSIQNTVPLKLGSFTGGGNDFFDGVLDEVRIYSRELRQEEAISGLYSRANVYFMRSPGLKFVSPAFTMTVNNPSPLVTVEMQDSMCLRDPTFNSTITLTADATGRFSPNRINWSASNTTVITLSAGVGYFYCRNSAVGNHIITASRPGYGSDSQTETIVNASAYGTNSYLVLGASSIPANGTSSCSAWVIVNDTYGYPVSGLANVTVTSSRAPNSTTITPVTTTTDANGQCTFNLRSYFAGVDTLTAKAGGNTATRGIDRTAAAGVWCFDTSTNDISGNGNNGTAYGNPVWVSGVYGSAVQFDGIDDSVSFGSSASLNFESNVPMTFMFWISLGDLVGSSSKDILNKADLMGANAQRGYRIYQYPNTVINLQLANERVPGLTYLCAGTASGIGAGWHHVAITYNGDSNAYNIQFYVDGSLVSKTVEANQLSGTIQNPKPLQMGHIDTSPVAFFPGILDEVVICSRVMTAGEINAVYASRAQLYLNATRLRITSPKRITVENVASDSIAIDAAGNSGGFDPVFFQTAGLNVSSLTGKFSVSSTTWQDTTGVYIAGGRAVFYYKDTTPGTYVLSVSRAGMLPDSQSIVVNTSPISETISYIRISAPLVLADNASACIAEVCLMDSGGNGLPAQSVVLSTTQGASDSINYPYGNVTDANGVCTALITSSYAGEDTITVSAGGKTITENLVDNPSFEDSFVSWAFSSAVVDTTVAKTGNRSCRLRATGAPVSDVLSQMIPVINSSWTSYDISGYIRATVTAGTYSLSVSFFTDTGALISSANIGSLTSTTSSWTRFSKTYGCSGSGAQVLLPQNCALVRITASSWAGAGANGTGWTDDIRMKRIPTVNFIATGFRFATAAFNLEQNAASNRIIVDASGNIGGRDVTFNNTVTMSSSSGGGFSLNNVTWLDTTIMSLSSGSVFFYYRDPAAGNPVLTASNDTMVQGTQTETITAIQALSNTASYIIFTPQMVASDGAAVCTAVVVANKYNGVPIEGKAVLFQTGRGAWDVIGGDNPSTTNSSGQCTFTISSVYAGRDTLTAVCGSDSVSRGFGKERAAGIWTLDLNANDISGNGNNGALNGSTAYAAGSRGSALSFNAATSDWVNCGNGASLNFETTTLMTFMFWMSHAGGVGGDILQRIQYIINGENYQRGYRIYNDTGKVCFQLANNRAGPTPPPAVNYLYAEMQNDIGAGWHHVAITYNGDANASNVKIYVNGSQVGTNIGSNNLAGTTLNNETLKFGCFDGWAGFFTGLLDEVIICTRALSQDEIQSYYNSRANIYFTQSPRLRFVSPAFTRTRTNPSPLITVEMQDTNTFRDTTFNSTITISADLTGRFSFDGTNWSGTNTTVLTLSSGAGTFYYKDTVSAFHVVTISRQGYGSDSQVEAIVDTSVYGAGSYLRFGPASVTANGVAVSTVTVTVCDTYGFRVSGIAGVTLSSARGSQTVITPVGSTTSDANGQCTFTVKSFSSGIDTISAVAQGNTATRGINRVSVAAIWPFDTSAYDISGYANNGVLYGPTWVNGAYGGAVQFNGTSDYIDCNTGSSLNFEYSTPITAMFWVSIDDLVGAASRDIFSKVDLFGGNTQRGLRIFQYPGTVLNFQIANDRVGAGGYLAAHTTNGIGGGWHHVAVSYKGDSNADNVQFYLDGNSVSTTVEANILAGTIQNAKFFSVGRMNDAPASYFDGAVDEARIYTRVVPLIEIISDYNASANVYFTQSPSLSFASPPFTMTVNNPSYLVTVEMQDTNTVRDTTFNGTVTLSADATGRFSLNRISWTSSNTTVITLSSGAGYFYYRNSAAGSRLITASRLGYGPDTQTETIVAASAFGTSSYIVLGASSIPANGVSSCTAWVTVNDSYGYPVSGLANVTIASSRAPNSTTITPVTTTTDLNGQCTFVLRSYFAGIDTLTARAGGNTITRGMDRTNAVGIWCFDTGAIDISGNGNHGVSYGEPVWAAGRYGSAVQFDGINDYFICGNSPSLNVGTSDFTISAWIKRSGGFGSYQRILIKRTDSSAQFYDLMFYDNNSVAASIAYNWPTIGQNEVSSTTAITDTDWHYVVAVFDRDGYGRMYLDGQPDGTPMSITTNSGSIANTASLFIGSYGTGAGPPVAQWFNGTLDEVKIHLRAFTQNEISASYNAAAPLFLNATKLKITTPARTMNIGDASDSIAVEAQGNSGGLDTIFQDTVTLLTSSSQGTFSLNSVPWVDTWVLSLVSGSGVFYYKDLAAGSPIITVTRYSLLGDNQTEIVLGGGAATQIVITSPQFRVRAGDTSPQITAVAEDAGNNTDVSFVNTVSLYTNSNSGSFSTSLFSWQNTSSITFSSGVGTFYYRDYSSGYPVISAYRVSLTAGIQVETITITDLQITNTPGFTITSISTAPIMVRARDGLGNTAVNSTDSVTLQSSSLKGKFSLSGTLWSDTTSVSLLAGSLVIYYKDKKGGNPIITVSRTDSWSFQDTQQETVSKPVVSSSKAQYNMRSGETGAMPMRFWPTDTVEYTIYISNTGTETSTGNVIIDTKSFDTNTNNAVDYVYMDTTGYADTWAYTTDPAFIVWTTGNPASGASDIKGLRWTINSLGINANKAIRFRVRVK